MFPLLQIGRFMEQWIFVDDYQCLLHYDVVLLLGTPEGSVTMIIMFSAYLIMRLRI